MGLKTAMACSHTHERKKEISKLKIERSLKKISISEAVGMAQRVKTLAVKPGDLSSLSGTHLVARDN